MRHFDAWLLRDPYSIFHYYSTGHRWKETVRDLIQDRKICAPLALSRGLDSDASMNPSTPIDPYARAMNPQASSSFLSKLPLEIRLIIYGYVFGNEVVHLVQVKDKIRHVRCRETSSSLDKNRRCCPVTPARWRANDLVESPANNSGTATVLIESSSMLYPHTHPSLPHSLSNSSTALIRTCRTIYTEASSILYRSASFDIDDLTTFIAFSLSISPTNLHAIKRLTIQWTPVWQPMAGEEHKSSIFSHTHNDRLWALFWNRVSMCSGLKDLALSVDLGSFSGSGAAVGAGNNNAAPAAAGAGVGGAQRLIGGNRLRLSVTEPWVAPLLSVRGLKTFELGITAKCDVVAKSVLEGSLVRDAVMLRDHLRAVMCSAPGAVLPPLPGVQVQDLSVQVELLRRCALETERQRGRDEGRGLRPRLAIDTS